MILLSVSGPCDWARSRVRRRQDHLPPDRPRQPPGVRRGLKRIRVPRGTAREPGVLVLDNGTVAAVLLGYVDGQAAMPASACAGAGSRSRPRRSRGLTPEASMPCWQTG